MRELLDTYDPRTSWQSFLAASAVALIALFWLLEPSASQDLNGMRLLAFWSLHVVIPLTLLQTTQLAISRFTQASSAILQVGVAGVIAAALFTPLALALDVLFAIPEEAQDVTGGFSTQMLDEFIGLAPSIILVWFALNATRLLRLPSVQRTATDTTDPELWHRVPKELGRDLVALSAELHYLRVYTTKGDALILASFGRTIADVSRHVDGTQIHRSHWIAFAHVVEIDRRGQAATCILTGGLRLPVSRSRKSNLTSGAAKAG